MCNSVHDEHLLLTLSFLPDSFDCFSTPLHRLKKKSVAAVPQTSFAQQLLSLAPYIQELTIKGAYNEVDYLLEHRDILGILLQNVKTLVVYHLKRDLYAHVRAQLFEEFILKGNVDALSLKHCVLEENEWHDLMTVCAGSAVVGSYVAPQRAGTKRKYEMDALLSSATKRLCHGSGHAPLALASQDEAESVHPPPRPTPSAADEADGPRGRSLKSFSIYVTHSFDFSSILGKALRIWDNLEKIEIWQPDAYSCMATFMNNFVILFLTLLAVKMILPNEINRKVRSGQIMHGTISGCLAVAGQLPLFLEALLIRHG
jgi:hypothetical protein